MAIISCVVETEGHLNICGPGVVGSCFCEQRDVLIEMLKQNRVVSKKKQNPISINYTTSHFHPILLWQRQSVIFRVRIVSKVQGSGMEKVSSKHINLFLY